MKKYMNILEDAFLFSKAEQEKISLRRSGDFFAKLIVTSGHEQLWTDEEGISHVGVIPFLLEEDILARILKQAE